MLKNWQVNLKKLVGKLWFKTVLYSLAGVITALLGRWLRNYIPDNFFTSFGVDSIEPILTILGSSMLAVTTFSLSIIKNASNNASAGVSPRVTGLVADDSINQNALATFLGSFLFSLVGIIALKSGIYGDKGRVVLFFVTLVIIALIVITMIRWINHLTDLGRKIETIEQVEATTLKMIKDRLACPYLGGKKMLNTEATLTNFRQLKMDSVGYVQWVDMQKIQETAIKLSAQNNSTVEIYLLSIPGTFVDCSKTVAYINCQDTSGDEIICNAITVASCREYDQDPRFGIIVLAEIATNATSPVDMDVGTAIDIIGRMVRIFTTFSQQQAASNKVLYPSIYVLPLQMDDLFDDFFPVVSRSCAGAIEINIRLQKALYALACSKDYEIARLAQLHAKQAFQRSQQAITYQQDLQTFEKFYHELWQKSGLTLT